MTATNGTNLEFTGHISHHLSPLGASSLPLLRWTSKSTVAGTGNFDMQKACCYSPDFRPPDLACWRRRRAGKTFAVPVFISSQNLMFDAYDWSTYWFEQIGRRHRSLSIHLQMDLLLQHLSNKRLSAFYRPILKLYIGRQMPSLAWPQAPNHVAMQFLSTYIQERKRPVNVRQFWKT